MQLFIIWLFANASVYFYCDAALFYRSYRFEKVKILKVKPVSEATVDFSYETYNEYYFDNNEFVSSNLLTGIKSGDSAYLLTSRKIENKIIWKSHKITFSQILNYNTVGTRSILSGFPFILFSWCVLFFYITAKEMQRNYRAQIIISNSKTRIAISKIRFHIPLVIALVIVGFPLFFLVNYMKSAPIEDKMEFSFFSGTGYMILFFSTSVLTEILYNIKYSKEENFVTLRDLVKIAASILTIITITGYFIKIATNQRIDIFKFLWDFIKSIT
jgi:hypothetical protein